VIHDKLVILKYLESTNAKFKNENELCSRLSRIFEMERSYVWHLLKILKSEHPKLYRTIKNTKETRTEGQERASSGFRKLSHKDKNIIIFKPKSHIVHVPRFAKTEAPKKEAVKLKDIKPVDGFESVWKEGKMKPTKQKTYRGSFQDKE